MITSARQLKDKIRNLSREKSVEPQVLFRVYMMERLLERIALSAFREKFILKGGMLVSSMVGAELRSTMDADVTVNGAAVNPDEVQKMMEAIISVPFTDGVSFTINDISSIMDEAEYPGVRVSMAAFMESMRVPLKTDISTGDVITPHAVEYPYKLMFEDRSINLLAYNLETVLAEKLETVISRTTVNTRMRDFYDIHILSSLYWEKIAPKTLTDALSATSRQRGSLALMTNAAKVLSDLRSSKEMQTLWENYRSRFNYASDISWDTALRSVQRLAISAGLQLKKPSLIEALHGPLPEHQAPPAHRKGDLER